MSDSDKDTVECMADLYMQHYESEYATHGRLLRERDIPVLLAAILKELREMRAEAERIANIASFVTSSGKG